MWRRFNAHMKRPPSTAAFLVTVFLGLNMTVFGVFYALHLQHVRTMLIYENYGAENSATRIIQAQSRSVLRDYDARWGAP